MDPLGVAVQEGRNGAACRLGQPSALQKPAPAASEQNLISYEAYLQVPGT